MVPAILTSLTRHCNTVVQTVTNSDV